MMHRKEEICAKKFHGFVIIDTEIEKHLWLLHIFQTEVKLKAEQRHSILKNFEKWGG